MNKEKIQDRYLKEYKTIYVDIGDRKCFPLVIPVYYNETLPNDFILRPEILTQIAVLNLTSKNEELQQENKELKADLEMYENGVYFSSENDKLQNEIDNLNHIIDKQDKDITILSKGNKHLKEILEKMGLEPNDILYLQQENKQLKENNMSMQEEMVRTWEKLDDLQQIEQEHQKINGELREENKKYKEVIDKAIDLIEKSGTTDIGIDSNNNIIHYHQLTEDETGELLDILKEVE